ncbi:MAG: S8 family peptidase, partial [Actinomycetota bacterium]
MAVVIAALSPIPSPGPAQAAENAPTAAPTPVEPSLSNDSVLTPGSITSDSPSRTRPRDSDPNSAVRDPGGSTVNADSSPDAGSNGAIVEGRYIVRVSRTHSVSSVVQVLTADGYDADPLGSGPLKFVLVTTDPAETAATSDLASTPGITGVWPDRRVSIAAEQSDAPWGLDRIDQTSLPLNGKFAYDSDGTGVTAYIVDTGVRGTHTDFGGRVTTGWNGTGDAGNGNSDCNGHGTHVAGTVGGTLYGVAKNVTIVPVRVLQCGGSGYTSTIVDGLNWIIADHDPGEPAVINMSLGGTADGPLDAAVAAAVADGIVTVVAAGNSSDDACLYSPARAPAAITVGSTTDTDEKSSFSNYGSCVDMWAPGSSIVSADYTADSGSRTLSGTSMASPHVAGAAARLLSFNQNLTVTDVTAIL